MKLKDTVITRDWLRQHGACHYAAAAARAAWSADAAAWVADFKRAMGVQP